MSHSGVVESLQKSLMENDTCSSSDTDSDQDVVVRMNKRAKIKMRRKSPVRESFEKGPGSDHDEQRMVPLDRYTENQLDCLYGRNAYEAMFNESVESESPEGVFNTSLTFSYY